MVFSKELDKSLIKILEADAENRSTILDFLNAIPQDTLEEIKQLVKRFEKAMREDGKYMFSEDVETSNGTYECDFLEEDENIIFDITFHADDEVEQLATFTNALSLETNHPFYEPDENEELTIGSVTHTMILQTNGKYTDTMKKNFVPALQLNGNHVEGVVLERESTTEYSIVYQGQVQNEIIKKENNLTGTSEILSVDVSTLPEDITIEYLNRKYGDTPKILEK